MLSESGIGYEPQAWESFGVAEVGAAAAIVVRLRGFDLTEPEYRRPPPARRCGP